MAETALIGLDVDLSLINRRLAEAGDLTAKEARGMQSELVRAFRHSARASEDAARQIAKATSKAARDAERDAKKAAREVERSVEGQASAVRGLFSAAIGGVGGDLLDLADATDGASASMAGLGVALGALAIAPAVLGGLAQGMIETANAGVEAKNALTEAGIAIEHLITPAALLALEEYEQQTLLTEQATQALTAQLGGAAAADAQIFNDAILGAKQALADASQLTGGFFATIGQLSERAVEYSSLPGFLLIQSLRDAGQSAGETKARVAELAAEQLRLAQETDAAAQSMQEQKDMLLALGLLTEEDTSSTDRNTAALDRQRAAYERQLAAVRAQLQALREETPETEEATASTETHADAVKELEEAYKGAQTASGLTTEEARKLSGAFNELNTSIAGGETEGDRSPMEKFEEDMQKASAAANMVADAIQPIIGNVQTLMGMEQRQHESRVDQLRSQRAASRETYQDALREFERTRDDMTQAELLAARMDLDTLQKTEAAKRAALREREKEAKQAALDGFRRAQALQTAAAIIESARNAIALTAAYVPVAGPYAPVVATGVAGAQLTTQLLIIKNTPPPKFHFGSHGSASTGQAPVGIPGAEFPALLEQGEGVLSRRAMATPGMADLVEMANAGIQPTARSSVTNAEADLLAQRLNRPYAPNIRGRALAGRNTFFRGR